MRLNKFESAGLEPVGEGDERKTFADPNNPERIISERKEGSEKDTPRQLKGRYYLTKIAHLLLPNNIPDVYQAGESRDGKQTVDAERISHTPGHARLQELRMSGATKEEQDSVAEQMAEELEPQMGDLDSELGRIGLDFEIDLDKNLGNYTKDEQGNVHYLETFKPWQINPLNPPELEIGFDEEVLREAIQDLPDEKTKEQCNRYLERLLTLLKEDRQEIQKNYESKLTECGPYIEDLEKMFDQFEQKYSIENLRSLHTEEEARNSEERESAKSDLTLMFSLLKILGKETDITDERLSELRERYRVFDQAVGIINRGTIDHDR